MNKTSIVKCSKCAKEYLMEIITIPAKMEETRQWETYYTCPYCGKSVTILLSSNEIVNTKEIEK